MSRTLICKLILFQDWRLSRQGRCPRRARRGERRSADVSHSWNVLTKMDTGGEMRGVSGGITQDPPRENFSKNVKNVLIKLQQNTKWVNPHWILLQNPFSKNLEKISHPPPWIFNPCTSKFFYSDMQTCYFSRNSTS